MFHVTGSEGKKEPRLFSVGFPALMQPVWLVERLKFADPVPKMNIHQERTNLMPTGYLCGCSPEERVHPTNKKCILIWTTRYAFLCVCVCGNSYWPSLLGSELKKKEVLKSLWSHHFLPVKYLYINFLPRIWSSLQAGRFINHPKQSKKSSATSLKTLAKTLPRHNNVRAQTFRYLLLEFLLSFSLLLRKALFSHPTRTRARVFTEHFDLFCKYTVIVFT